MAIAFTISTVLLVIAVAACVVLYRQRADLAAAIAAAQVDHDAELRALEQTNASLDKDLAVLRQRHEDDERRLNEFKEQIENHLKALAGESLKASRDEFLKQAGERFKPLEKTLGDYRDLLREIEKHRTGAYSKMTEQIDALKIDQTRLQQETAKLVKALRRPEVRGRWGELQMQRLFELAGMTEHVDYDEQATLDDGGKSLRPDFTIRLPNGRVIVVDAKTPIDAYLDATEATDERTREELYERHARQLRTAAANLASKGYADKCDGSPEFVVMFVPGEAMLYAAARHDPNLIEWAMEKNVVIATPTVVIALLKTVAMGWREKSLAENAEKIANLGRELHERLAVVLGHVSGVGKRLDKTVGDYNKLVASIDTRLTPTLNKFTDLKAESPRQLPDSLDPVIEIPRQLTSAPGNESATSDT